MIPAKVEASKTLALLQKVKQMKADGLDVASFTAGEPDFPTPNFVIEQAYNGMKEGDTTYCPSQGKADLREVIAKDYSQRLGASWVKPEHVLVTLGSKQAISLIMSTILMPGDEVIVPTPYWVSYPGLVKACNGVMVKINSDDSCFPTVEQLQAVKTDKTKILIFSTPNNPSGKMIELDKLKNIVNWCVENKVYLVFDEIYERLVHGDLDHTSASSLVNHEQSEYLISVNACSKSMAMTGWRLGYAISHTQNIRNLTAMQSQFVTCVPGFIQQAGKVGIERAEEFIPKVRDTFKKRRELILKGLAEIPKIKAIVPDGAFYVLVNAEELIQSRGLADDKKLAEVFLEEKLLSVVPGSGFGTPGHIRLSFATSEEEINKGLVRLKEFCES